jgi:prepilin-type N-terminal cleavage/methylation domain-containing protein
MRNLRSGSAGFTLVEIMISIAILSISLVSIYVAQGNSLRASGSAEKIQIASLLAQQKMNEKILEINKDMEKGLLPEDKAIESGNFEAPFEAYRWEYSVRSVTLPLAGGGGGAEAGTGGAGEGENTQGTGAQMAPESAQRSIAQIVTKKIQEAVREINVRIVWEELGEEQDIKVSTHVAKL